MDNKISLTEWDSGPCITDDSEQQTNKTMYDDNPMEFTHKLSAEKSNNNLDLKDDQFLFSQSLCLDSSHVSEVQDGKTLLSNDPMEFTCKLFSTKREEYREYKQYKLLDKDILEAPSTFCHNYSQNFFTSNSCIKNWKNKSQSMKTLQQKLPSFECDAVRDNLPRNNEPVPVQNQHTQFPKPILDDTCNEKVPLYSVNGAPLCSKMYFLDQGQIQSSNIFSNDNQLFRTSDAGMTCLTEGYCLNVSTSTVGSNELPIQQTDIKRTHRIHNLKVNENTVKEINSAVKFSVAGMNLICNIYTRYQLVPDRSATRKPTANELNNDIVNFGNIANNCSLTSEVSSSKSSETVCHCHKAGIIDTSNDATLAFSPESDKSKIPNSVLGPNFQLSGINENIITSVRSSAIFERIAGEGSGIFQSSVNNTDLSDHVGNTSPKCVTDFSETDNIAKPENSSHEKCYRLPLLSVEYVDATTVTSQTTVSCDSNDINSRTLKYIKNSVANDKFSSPEPTFEKCNFETPNLCLMKTSTSKSLCTQRIAHYSKQMEAVNFNKKTLHQESEENLYFKRNRTSKSQLAVVSPDIQSNKNVMMEESKPVDTCIPLDFSVSDHKALRASSQIDVLFKIKEFKIISSKKQDICFKDNCSSFDHVCDQMKGLDSSKHKPSNLDKITVLPVAPEMSEKHVMKPVYSNELFIHDNEVSKMGSEITNLETVGNHTKKHANTKEFFVNHNKTTKVDFEATPERIDSHAEKGFDVNEHSICDNEVFKICSEITNLKMGENHAEKLVDVNPYFINDKNTSKICSKITNSEMGENYAEKPVDPNQFFVGDNKISRNVSKITNLEMGEKHAEKPIDSNNFFADDNEVSKICSKITNLEMGENHAEKHVDFNNFFVDDNEVSKICSKITNLEIGENHTDKPFDSNQFFVDDNEVSKTTNLEMSENPVDNQHFMDIKKASTIDFEPKLSVMDKCYQEKSFNACLNVVNNSEISTTSFEITTAEMYAKEPIDTIQKHVNDNDTCKIGSEITVAETNAEESVGQFFINGNITAKSDFEMTSKSNEKHFNMPMNSSQIFVNDDEICEIESNSITNSKMIETYIEKAVDISQLFVYNNKASDIAIEITTPEISESHVEEHIVSNQHFINGNETSKIFSEIANLEMTVNHTDNPSGAKQHFVDEHEESKLDFKSKNSEMIEDRAEEHVNGNQYFVNDNMPSEMSERCTKRSVDSNQVFVDDNKASKLGSEIMNFRMTETLVEEPVCQLFIDDNTVSKIDFTITSEMSEKHIQKTVGSNRNCECKEGCKIVSKITNCEVVENRADKSVDVNQHFIGNNIAPVNGFEITSEISEKNVKKPVDSGQMLGDEVCKIDSGIMNLEIVEKHDDKLINVSQLFPVGNEVSKIDLEHITSEISGSHDDSNQYFVNDNEVSIIGFEVVSKMGENHVKKVADVSQLCLNSNQVTNIDFEISVPEIDKYVGKCVDSNQLFSNSNSAYKTDPKITAPENHKKIVNVNQLSLSASKANFEMLNEQNKKFVCAVSINDVLNEETNNIFISSDVSSCSDNFQKDVISLTTPLVKKCDTSFQKSVTEIDIRPSTELCKISEGDCELYEIHSESVMKNSFSEINSVSHEKSGKSIGVNLLNKGVDEQFTNFCGTESTHGKIHFDKLSTERSSTNADQFADKVNLIDEIDTHNAVEIETIPKEKLNTNNGCCTEILEATPKQNKTSFAITHDGQSIQSFASLKENQDVILHDCQAREVATSVINPIKETVDCFQENTSNTIAVVNRVKENLFEEKNEESPTKNKHPTRLVAVETVLCDVYRASRETVLWCIKEVNDFNVVFSYPWDSEMTTIDTFWDLCLSIEFGNDIIIENTSPTKVVRELQSISFKSVFRESVHELTKLASKLFRHNVGSERNLVKRYPDTSYLLQLLCHCSDALTKARNFIIEVQVTSFRHQFSVENERLVFRIPHVKLVSEFFVKFPTHNIELYPDVKLVPVTVSHIRFNRISESVIQNIVEEIETGENYLYRAVTAISDFKP